jgi:hypothetical protein
MASQSTAANLQGPKRISGSNAAFSDKVIVVLQASCLDRSSQIPLSEQAYGTSFVQYGRCEGCVGPACLLTVLTRNLAISDAVRTSLGPRGMDKMVCSATQLSRQGLTSLRSKRQKEK